MRRRSAVPRAGSCSPSTEAVPSKGRYSPATTPSSVLFPAPLGPSTPVTRAGWTSRSTRCRASRRPRRHETPASRTTAAAGPAAAPERYPLPSSSAAPEPGTGAASSGRSSSITNSPLWLGSGPGERGQPVRVGVTGQRVLADQAHARCVVLGGQRARVEHGGLVCLHHVGVAAQWLAHRLRKVDDVLYIGSHVGGVLLLVLPLPQRGVGRHENPRQGASLARDPRIGVIGQLPVDVMFRALPQVPHVALVVLGVIVNGTRDDFSLDQVPVDLRAGDHAVDPPGVVQYHVLLRVRLVPELTLPPPGGPHRKRVVRVADHRGVMEVLGIKRRQIRLAPHIAEEILAYPGFLRAPGREHGEPEEDGESGQPSRYTSADGRPV